MFQNKYLGKSNNNPKLEKLNFNWQHYRRDLSDKSPPHPQTKSRGGNEAINLEL